MERYAPLVQWRHLLTRIARADQVANRKHREPSGGGPVDLDKEFYKRRMVIVRLFNTLKQWRGHATRYAKLAPTDRGAAAVSPTIDW